MATRQAIQELANALLDMSSAARMKRAKEQGFDTSRVLYHGTDENIKAFDPERLGEFSSSDTIGNVSLTPSPGEASAYARGSNDGSGQFRKWVYDEDLGRNISEPSNPNILPLLVRGKIKKVDASGDLFDARTMQAEQDLAISEGYAGIEFDGLQDSAFYNPLGVTSTVKMFDPSDIRSVNAAFDPAKIDSPNLLAGGAAAAVGLGAATQGEDAEAGVITKGGKRLIEAFHGSPHKFDRFSMQNIGTGEGAQAYGHGLYFADSEDVAKEYQQRLTDYRVSLDGRTLEPIKQDFSHLGEEDALAARQVVNAVFSDPRKGGVEGLRDSLSDQRQMYADALADAAPDDAEFIADELAGIDRQINLIDSGRVSEPKGSFYRVHIDADPDALLDWDKPLSEQSEAVQKALADIDPDMYSPDGADYDPAERGGVMLERLKAIANQQGAIGEHMADLNPAIMRGDKAAAEMLRRRGVPGIRYLDGNSRSAGDGSYNYVMFDDAPISIQERGNATPGMLGATAAGTGAAITAEPTESDIMRLVNALGKGAGFVFDSLELPTRGLHGLANTTGRLIQGQGLDQALQGGANVARQSIPETAQQLGTYTADKTGNPYLAALVDAITNVTALEP